MKYLRISICCLLGGASAWIQADHPTLSLDEGGPGPLTTISAVPMAEGSFAASFQSQFLFNDEISDFQLKQYALNGNPVHSTGYLSSYSLNSGLGVSDRFMLGFSIPYITRSDFRETRITNSNQNQASQSSGSRSQGPLATGENHPLLSPAHAGEPHNRNLRNPHKAVAEVVSYDIEGVGDATLFGQYLVYKNDGAGTFLSLLGGLKLPTGETGERDPFGSFVSTDHQPGTGSWDPLLGIAATKQHGAWSFDVNGLYTFSTEGERGVTVGDVFNYNAAISYRILGQPPSSEHHHDHTGHEHEHDHVDEKKTILDVFVEANGDYREAADFSGIRDGNTGGNTLFLSGGSRLGLPNGWSAAFSVGAPILIDLNGIQSEPNLRVLVGVSKAF